MNIRSLVWSEILHRKLNFLLALSAVAVAVACSVSVITLLHSHQLHTHQRIEEHRVQFQQRVADFEKESRDRITKLDDEIRKITRNMGFNLMILPKDLNLADFYAADFADKTMPQSLVHRLANSPEIVKVNHLRPALIRKLSWPEQNRQIILMGVSGIVPLVHRNPKKPLAEPVPQGTMNLGSVLANELKLRVDDEVTFKKEKFKINKIYPPRGNKDDITAWIGLEKAQQILGLPGQINLIQALECNCSSIDRLAEVQEEISKALSDQGDQVQVVEMSTKAIARAKARNKVKQEGIATLARIKAQGDSTLESVTAEGAATVARVEWLAAVLMPLAIVGACLMVGLLFLANVRERRAEIGILRAVGTGSRQILSMFVSKALLLGILGAIVGYLVGFFGTVALETTARLGTSAEISTSSLFLWQLPVITLSLAPLLAMLASWLPAITAVVQDPANVLREE